MNATKQSTPKVVKCLWLLKSSPPSYPLQPSGSPPASWTLGPLAPYALILLRNPLPDIQLQNHLSAKLPAEAAPAAVAHTGFKPNSSGFMGLMQNMHASGNLNVNGCAANNL